MTPQRHIYLAIALERFAWYAMLGALVLWQGETSVGNLLFWAYLAPLVGGWLGALLTLRSVAIAGATTLAAGYALAAIDQPSRALIALALGCGLFKPCLGTLLGSLYPIGPDRTQAYSHYYIAIQIGSLPSTLVGAWLRGHFGFWAVFAVCATAAAAAGLALAAGWSKLQPRRESIAEAVIDGAITKAQWGKLAGLLAGAVVFFAAFQQQQTTLVIWARDVCHVKYPETLSSLNPLFCMALLLVPVIGAWSALRERMATAMLAIAAAFGLLMLSQHLRGGDSIAWLVGWYALGTLGEALISPLGMDLVTSLVPRRYAPLAMSLWLLSMSAGGYLAGLASVRTVGLTAVACVGAAVWFWVSERPRIEAAQPAPSAQLTANQL